MHARSLRVGVRVVTRVRLVVGGVHDRHAVGLQAVAERWSRMVEIAGGDAHRVQVEHAFRQLVVPDGRGELAQRDRKVRALHLAAQDLLQRATDLARRIDVPLAARHEQRGEERKPLDVVPVGMGDQQVAADGTGVGGDDLLSQLVGAGAAVQFVIRLDGT
jgi:hypothetical protein